MTERPVLSPSEKRAGRKTARKGDRLRRQAIEQAMRARWAGNGADELSWPDEAAHAQPDPDTSVRALYGLAARLVERLAEATGEEREQISSQALR